MTQRNESRPFLRLLCLGLLVAVFAAPLAAQINPAEIREPHLRTIEKAYFPQLVALNRAILAVKYPFPFVPSPYVGLDPAQQVGADTRGLEFVRFHGRVVLKISGNYNAAYNSALMTRNERASRTFQDVVAPIMQLIAKDIPAGVECDAVGFEIAYHVRVRTKNSDFEGKEILVALLDRDDAFAFPHMMSDADRQQVLNRSEIYVNGQTFGLALAGREPLDLQALKEVDSQSLVPVASQSETPPSMAEHARLTVVHLDPPTGVATARPHQASPLPNYLQPGAANLSSHAVSEVPAASASAATPDDADRLQTRYQQQLDALAKEGVATLHFVGYAPLSFVAFRGQIELQITMRNPERFDSAATSIYKRAARSFDLFLAPRLKSILDKVPAGAEISGLDITVLDEIGSTSGPSSEALEYVMPIEALRRFAGAEITNQTLIDQSVVLVNGVRIALNLQLVE